MARRKKFITKEMLQIILALIGVLGTMGVAYFQFVWRPSQSGSNEPTVTQYTGRILDGASLKPIANAKITLDLPGLVSQIAYTDTEGVYLFSLALKQEQLNGLISVSATGYENYSRSINLSASLLNIGDIRLFPVSISETPTNTAEPTFTATWTPMPSLTPFVAKTIFEDTFIDNRNRWFVASGFPNIVAGKYTHKVSCLSTNPSLYCTSYVVTIPFKFPRNFYIEMDATILELSPGGKVAIGFQVRKSGAGYYQFNYFVTDGSYQLDFISASGNSLTIIPETTTNLINKDLEATNRLGVEINDSLLVPIVNGQEIAQGKDGSLLNAGGAYLTIFTSRETFATVQISNLTVQEVP